MEKKFKFFSVPSASLWSILLFFLLSAFIRVHLRVSASLQIIGIARRSALTLALSRITGRGNQK